MDAFLQLAKMKNKTNIKEQIIIAIIMIIVAVISFFVGYITGIIKVNPVLSPFAG